MGDNRESGFINSEPCISEFITNIPHINHTLDGPSITGHESGGGGFCQTFNGGLPGSPTRGDLALAGTPEAADHVMGSVGGGGGGKYMDYEWMKDKKLERKCEPPQTVPDIGRWLHTTIC